MKSVRCCDRMKPSTHQVAQSNEGPLVTIWTSCYNHEPYLDEYFQGLLAQTYSNIQLILIDDGSQDGSWTKIRSYEARLRDKFPLVVLERHENIGAVEEFLTHCWQHAAGEYFCMLESDDYYLPTKIEENVKYLQAHPEMGAVHSEVDYVYDDHVEYRHWESTGMKIPEGDIFEALLLGNFIMTCSFCCRTKLIREHVNWRAYLAKGYMTSDYACFLDLARITRFGYIDKSLARYRVLANSASHTTDLSRRYLLVKKHHMMKLDYIELYGTPARFRHAALEHIHRTNMEYGYLLYLPEQFWEGYRWLAQESPAHCRAMRPRIRALAMRHKLLWRLIHTAEVRILFPISHARKALRRGASS
jgi:glycosyltransferase involved in cell wall biosynthesis